MRARGPVLSVLIVATVTLAVVNVVVVRRNLDLRRGRTVPVAGAAAMETAEEPDLHVFLFFSPSDCSSHFLGLLDQWERFFGERHGSHVWVSVVATYSSRAELGRFWEALGRKRQVVVDERGELMRRFGVQRTPATVVTDRGGHVVFREEFPRVRDGEGLGRLVRELLGDALARDGPGGTGKATERSGGRAVATHAGHSR